MTPEEKELFQKSIILAEENNKLLQSIKRSLLISRIMSYIYFIFIVGSAVGAYYLIQPYFDKIMTVYKGVDFTTVVENFKVLNQ
ncbi:MAG: hypothetical protein ABL899_02295 [Nitrospira sp.]